MSNKIKGFTIALEKDISEEHAANLKSALLQIKGVAAVTELECSHHDYVNRMQIRAEFQNKILELVFPKKE